MSILLRNIRAIDPKNKVDETLDCLIERGKISKLGKNLSAQATHTVEGKNLCLVPGLIDLHTHFREPGFEYKETIETGTRAALRGGFVACVSMPNTEPACDNQNVVAAILRRAADSQFNIFPCGTISKGRLGKEIS